MTALLSCDGLSGGYGDLEVVHEVNLYIGPAEFIGLLGRNGVGKSTLLKLLLGEPQAYAPNYPRRFAGRVFREGRDISRLPLHRMAAWGVQYVPESGGVFPDLTVAENLRIHGGRVAGPASTTDLFPPLRARLAVRAGQLSGGEQRMLAFARALLASPRLLIIDKLSIGLQPSAIEVFVASLRAVRRDSELALIVVDERISMMLDLVDRVLAMDKGRIVLDEAAEPLRRAPSLLSAHLVV